MHQFIARFRREPHDHEANREEIFSGADWQDAVITASGIMRTDEKLVAVELAEEDEAVELVVDQPQEPAGGFTLDHSKLGDKF
jgi:hypothetical protein